MLDRTLELAKLMGMVLTDGGISCGGGKFRLHFTTTSPVLEESFRSMATRILKRKITVDRSHGAVKQIVWVHDIRDMFDELSPSFRTQACDSFPISPCLKGLPIHSEHIVEGDKIFPPTKIPDFVFEDKEKAREFLKLAFSCDGGVTLCVAKSKSGFRLDRKIRLFCEHPTLKRQHAELLKKFDLKPQIISDGIRLSGKVDIKKFSEEIDFLKGVKVVRKGLWRGIEKSKLLELCVQSFDLPEIFRLKTKEEIVSFLKELASGTERVSI